MRSGDGESELEFFLPSFVSPWDGRPDFSYVMVAVASVLRGRENVEAYYPGASLEQAESGRIIYKDGKSTFVRRVPGRDVSGLEAYEVIDNSLTTESRETGPCSIPDAFYDYFYEKYSSCATYCPSTLSGVSGMEPAVKMLTERVQPVGV